MTIVEFPPVSAASDPVVYKDTSLKSRTVARNPDNSLSTSASLTFNNTQCDDKAEYKWTYSIYIPGNGTDNGEQTSVVNIKGELCLKLFVEEFPHLRVHSSFDFHFYLFTAVTQIKCNHSKYKKTLMQSIKV